jgi:hypothetical protein
MTARRNYTTMVNKLHRLGTETNVSEETQRYAARLFVDRPPFGCLNSEAGREWLIRVGFLLDEHDPANAVVNPSARSLVPRPAEREPGN